MATERNCQGHCSVERPTPQFAQTTHSVSPVCRRIHGLVRFEPEAIQAWLNGFTAPSTEKPPGAPRHTAEDVDHLIAVAKAAHYTSRREKPDKDRATQGGQ